MGGSNGLKLLKSDWGMEHLGDMRARLRAYAEAGCDGLECSQIGGLDPEEFAELARELGLDYVGMVFCDHEDDFETLLAEVM
ncbi:MAG: hypothetical protein OXG37_05090 [Actinomycetia bacterium]|nr:hypothetical protein [Actinomycetes bacterium]